MNDKIVESLKNIETHADMLMSIPANEQYIGSIQSVVSIALLEIKRCLEQIADVAAHATPPPVNALPPPWSQNYPSGPLSPPQPS